MELVSGVRVSAHVPAVDSNNRQNVVIKRGMSETATCPVWDGITLIPDEITSRRPRARYSYNRLHAVRHEGVADRRWLGQATGRPFLISYSLDRLGAARPSRPEESCRRLSLLW